MPAGTLTWGTKAPYAQGTVLGRAAVVSAVVLAASLLGIASRPAGLLASVWPANAILLGLFIRFPAFAAPAGWVAAFLGYATADLLTGGSLKATLLLTLGNLTGVAVGCILFARLREDDRQLRQPEAVLYLSAIACVAAAAAGIVGAIANPVLFGRSALSGWIFWASTELVNYIAILPVMLTFSRPKWPPVSSMSWRLPPEAIHTAVPAAALAVSCAAAVLIGGPGAFAFPVPALLWCGLSYSLALTAVLTFVFSVWTLLAISTGFIVEAVDLSSQHAMISIRLGVTLMALAPITVSSINAVRNDLLDQLRRLATFDPLTGALNRRAFTEQSNAAFASSESTRRPLAVLMLDIDDFKRINDTYGHAGGDKVLRTAGATLPSCLRNNDLLGRLGGEEFAIVIPDCTFDEAVAVANRIRRSLAEADTVLEDSRRVLATISIGLAFARRANPDMQALLSRADAALYRAKNAGRNRVELADAA